MMLLGAAPVPDHLYAPRPGCSKIKNSMPVNPNRSNRRVIFGLGEKEKLIAEIKICLGQGIGDAEKIYDEILKKQANEKKQIIPKNDHGDLLSIYSFKDIVCDVRRDFPGVLWKYNKTDEVVEMHRKKFSKSEIAIRFGVSEAHIHRILVNAGLIQKRRSPKK